MTDRDWTYRRAVLSVLVVWSAALVLFLLWPGLDLQISDLFWEPGRGFWAGQDATLLTIRTVLKSSGELAFLVCLVLCLASLAAPNGAGWRNWAYICAGVALGPGLLVNLILKAHMGRARPDTVTQFGGTLDFSPPFALTDQCSENCSFTSGEASLFAALAIPLTVLIWRHLWRRQRVFVVATIATYVVFGSGMRVAMGRHFFSDTVFSVLFSGLIALVLYKALDIGSTRDRFHRRAILADIQQLLGLLKRAMRSLSARLAIPLRRPGSRRPKSTCK